MQTEQNTDTIMISSLMNTLFASSAEPMGPSSIADSWRSIGLTRWESSMASSGGSSSTLERMYVGWGSTAVKRDT